MRIWLVRHAKTSWSGERYCGRSDPPLSDDGIAQANALGARLASVLGTEVEVWSSPALRARDTAARLGRMVRLDERLLEVDLGSVEGLTFAELSSLHPDLGQRVASGDARIDWPGGESWRALDQRVSSLWASLERAGHDAVVVSHGGTLRALVRHVLGDDRAFAPCEVVSIDGPPWGAA
ncbi:MAG: histidine phosphatase family protein [Chloroflexi bacterium]|nr:histidine phosphatase family protein [Chloroflexota bacterium]